MTKRIREGKKMLHESFEEEFESLLGDIKNMRIMFRNEYREVFETGELSREKILAMLSDPVKKLILNFKLLGVELSQILEDDELVAFLLSNNDKKPLNYLLVKGFDDFMEARYNHSVEDIVRRYRENPLHLDIMMCDNLEGAVRDNISNFETVALVIKCYDADVVSIAESLNENDRKVFEEIVEQIKDEEMESEHEE